MSNGVSHVSEEPIVVRLDTLGKFLHVEVVVPNVFWQVIVGFWIIFDGGQ